MIKYLKDCNLKELKDYCASHECCNNCPFNASITSNSHCFCFIDRSYLSNEALDTEIDIRVKIVLTKEEKEKLLQCYLVDIGPKYKVESIIKQTKTRSYDNKKYPQIEIAYKEIDNKKREYAYTHTYTYSFYHLSFKNMEDNAKYSFQDLGINVDDYELKLIKKENTKNERS